MRLTLTTLLITFILTGCDGLDFDSLEDSENSTFTSPELAFNVIFSSDLLDNVTSTNNDGFIVLFNSSSELEEIQLSPTSDDALVGEYEWDVIDEELQVTYANDSICTTNKTENSTVEYTATSDCENGTPENDEIEGTIMTALSFDADDLNSFSIDIDNADYEDDVRLEFFTNGNFEITELDSDGDPITSTTQLGTYEDSNLTNVVKVDNLHEDSDEYRLFILLSGSLNQGKILELRYTDADELETVVIYDIKDDNEWEAVSYYDDISIDQ